MALCFLTATWKTERPRGVGQSGGFIDGLLAIVVDHGLRAESKEEAHIVSRRVSEMGIFRFECTPLHKLCWCLGGNWINRLRIA